MRTWRRLIALALMIVFMPNIVLAAAPLRLCLGNDGHRAIESAFSAHHHSGHAKPSIVAAAGKVLAMNVEINTAQQTCRDVLLSAAIQTVKQSDNDFTNVISSDSTRVLALKNVPLLTTPDANRYSAAKPFERCRKDLDPRLADLATVVLLN